MMYLDTVLSQTAYAYDRLARLAFLETGSERYMTVCKSVAQLRHVVAQNVYAAAVGIDFGRFDLAGEGYGEYAGRVLHNDCLLVERLVAMGDAGDVGYVRAHVDATLLVVDGYADYFAGRSDAVEHGGWYVCHDCGWAGRDGETRLRRCARCGSATVDRADMI